MKNIPLLCLFIWSSSTLGNCEPPSADNFKNARLPEFKGVISEVKSGNKICVSNKKIKMKELQLNANSTIVFSQFGGSVEIKDLRVRDKIELWTEKCQKIFNEKVNVQAIMVYR